MPRAPPVTSASLPARRICGLQLAFERRAVQRERLVGERGQQVVRRRLARELDVALVLLRAREHDRRRRARRAHDQRPAGLRSRPRRSMDGTARSAARAASSSGWVVTISQRQRSGTVPSPGRARCAREISAHHERLTASGRSLRHDGSSQKRSPGSTGCSAAASSSSSSSRSPRAIASVANAHSQRAARVTRAWERRDRRPRPSTSCGRAGRAARAARRVDLDRVIRRQIGDQALDALADLVGEVRGRRAEQHVDVLEWLAPASRGR